MCCYLPSWVNSIKINGYQAKILHYFEFLAEKSRKLKNGLAEKQINNWGLTVLWIPGLHFFLSLFRSFLKKNHFFLTNDKLLDYLTLMSVTLPTDPSSQPVVYAEETIGQNIPVCSIPTGNILTTNCYKWHQERSTTNQCASKYVSKSFFQQGILLKFLWKIKTSAGNARVKHSRSLKLPYSCSFVNAVVLVDYFHWKQKDLQLGNVLRLRV